YIYMANGTNNFKLLTSTQNYPADLSTTTNLDGKTVKYIVRVKTGTLNRGIYQFALLFDPQKDPQPNPPSTDQGWNRKIVFSFGGDAKVGYRQGVADGEGGGDIVSGPFTSNATQLAEGFAMITSTLNRFGTNANDVLSAETASMVKEKF